MFYEFKIGDIVTCGRSGWWRVRNMDPQNQNRMLIELVMDSKGNIPKKNSRCFNASKQWCNKVTPESIKKQRDLDCKRWDTLLYIVDPTQEVEDKSILKSLENKDKPEPDYLVNIGPPPSLLQR